MTRVRAGAAVLGALLPSLAFNVLTETSAQEPAAVTSMVPYADARPLFALLRPALLPDPLRDLDPSDRERRWADWLAYRDSEIASRITRGNEDSIANLLFFGTSFTDWPRFRFADIAHILDDADALQRLRRRIDDLVLALDSDGVSDRLSFVRDVATAAGSSPDGNQDGVREFLIRVTARAIRDRGRYDEADSQAKRAEDSSAKLISRGTLFRDRGLATDTSLFPNHALDEALKVLQAENVLESRSIRRVAIIGPGLDFVDKQDGYDFYPVQTIQPFAVMDSLVRLGAAARDVRVTAFDINPRVIDHLFRARQRAASGEGYTVWLPRDREERWTAALVAFWERMGETLGQEVRVSIPSAIPRSVQVRSVRIQPDAVLRTTAQRLNIVLQRLDLEAAAKYDLIIATNALVYYDVFDQSLALANIAAMLRPGGVFLSNNLVVPDESMALTGHIDVPYTQSGDGDRILSYRRR